MYWHLNVKIMYIQLCSATVMSLLISFPFAHTLLHLPKITALALHPLHRRDSYSHFS